MPYPNILDSFTYPSGTALIADPSFDHAASHRTLGSAVVGIETTLGTNSGTSILKNFVAGDFPVRMNSGGTLQQAITGTINLSGTLNNIVLGTPAITGGTATNLTLTTPTISAGAITTTSLAANAVTNVAGVGSIGISQVITSSDPTTTDITGGSVTLVTSGGSCVVSASVNGKKDTNTSYFIIYLIQDGTQVQYGVCAPPIANVSGNISIPYSSSPAAGTHTWKLGGAVGVGTLTVATYSLTVLEIKK